MSVEKYFKESWHAAKNINLKLFADTFLYLLLSLLSFYIIPQLYSWFITFAFKLANLPTVTLTNQAQQQTALSAMILYLIITVIFALIFISTISYFYHKTWNALVNQKTTIKSTLKFMALSLLSLIAVITIATLIFFGVSFTFSSNLKYLGFTIHFISIVYAIYTFASALLIFSKTHKIYHSLKNSFILPIKNYKILIPHFIISFLVLVVSNVLWLAIFWLPDSIKLVIESLVLIAYISWIKIYFVNSLKSVKL